MFMLCWPREADDPMERSGVSEALERVRFPAARNPATRSGGQPNPSWFRIGNPPTAERNGWRCVSGRYSAGSACEGLPLQFEVDWRRIPTDARKRPRADLRIPLVEWPWR